MGLKLSVSVLEKECNEDIPEFTSEEIHQEIKITFNNYLIIFGKIKNHSLHADLMSYYKDNINYLC